MSSLSGEMIDKQVIFTSGSRISGKKKINVIIDTGLEK